MPPYALLLARSFEKSREIFSSLITLGTLLLRELKLLCKKRWLLMQLSMMVLPLLRPNYDSGLDNNNRAISLLLEGRGGRRRGYHSCS